MALPSLIDILKSFYPMDQFLAEKWKTDCALILCVSLKLLE